MSVLDTIKNLREELNQHNYNYYVLDNPTISDFEFDQKLKQLQDLEEGKELLITPIKGNW